MRHKSRQVFSTVNKSFSGRGRCENGQHRWFICYVEHDGYTGILIYCIHVKITMSTFHLDKGGGYKFNLLSSLCSLY